MILNLTNYDNLPFQDFLITTNKKTDLGLKLKHRLAQPDIVTAYIYASA
jgi:hypothetical protein